MVPKEGEKLRINNAKSFSSSAVQVDFSNFSNNAKQFFEL